MTTTSPTDSVYCRQIGSLPKPEEVRPLLLAQMEGRPYDARLLDDLVLQAMHENVRRQIAFGYPLVVSGEPDRLSFFHHIFRGVTGLKRVVGASQAWLPADLEDFGEVAQATYTPAVRHFPSLKCTGPITESDPEAIYREIDLYKQALALNRWPPEQAIITEPSLGTLANVIDIADSPYKTRQALIVALGQVMRRRYKAVIAAKCMLSVDIPDALMYQTAGKVTREQFLANSDMQVAVLNEALEGLPLDRIHAHSCYGNYRGTDTRDESLRTLIGPLLKLRVGTLFLEGSLSRHREDYLVLQDLLDAGKIPDTLSFGIGVIDTKYFSVEDEQEVAHRIVAMRRVLGSRLAAVAPDCGYETMTAIPNVPSAVVWAKSAVLPQAVALANSAIARMEAQASTPFASTV